jgi:hypothetical protein
MTKDFDKYLEEYKTIARNSLIFVYPAELRGLFEKAIDLQVETGKVVTKTVTENFNKFAPAVK